MSRKSKHSPSSVLFLTFALSGGGAQAVCKAWASEFAARGHSVVTVVLDGVTQEDRETLEALGVNVIDLLRIAGSSHVKRVQKFIAILTSTKVQTVISLETYPNLIALLAGFSLRHRRPRVVVSEHNLPSLLLRAERFSQHVQLFFAKRLYRKSDHIIAVSHAVAADLRAGFGIRPEQLSVVVNPALAANAASSTCAEELPNSVRLLIPARLVKQKRPNKVLDVARALSTRTDVEVVWVGDSSDGSTISPDESDRFLVRHLPWQSSWWEYADNHTVVLLASAYEGLGNVLVQAAERGVKTVVGAAALGTADAVLPGITGEIAESDLDSSYVAAVERVLSAKTGSFVEPWLQRFRPQAAYSSINRIISSLPPNGLDLK
ncbi:hypothetical protein GCM10023201_33290 [Actinomycetospora corticicola]|nr:glycosyltransferase [Actinomycetospora corticicola]